MRKRDFGYAPGVPGDLNTLPLFVIPVLGVVFCEIDRAILDVGALRISSDRSGQNQSAHNDTCQFDIRFTTVYSEIMAEIRKLE